MTNTCENCKYHDMPTTSGICLECLHIPATCALWEQKPQTNADRIRQMTDEELAEWMIEQEKYAFSFFGVQLSEEVNQHNKEQYLVWLKKEVADEHTD